METKKERNPVKKVINWWNGLSFSTQLWITCGVWFADGLLYGSAIANIKNNKKIKKAAEVGAAQGYMLGQVDAYKDIASQNPFKDIKNPTVKKF